MAVVVTIACPPGIHHHLRLCGLRVVPFNPYAAAQLGPAVVLFGDHVPTAWREVRVHPVLSALPRAVVSALPEETLAAAGYCDVFRPGVPHHLIAARVLALSAPTTRPPGHAYFRVESHGAAVLVPGKDATAAGDAAAPLFQTTPVVTDA